ncbi:MAG TPA: hypothetical protein DEF36_06430 [Desulfotomaculum sp.]|nr:hypothetical protein [Desulfotomaculum sp.]
MKKQIIAGIAIIACVALCAAVWPRSAEVEDLPVEPIKTAVTSEIEANPKEAPPIILSADDSEVVAESESPKTEAIAAEEKTEPMPPTEPVSETASIPSATPKTSAQPSSNSKSGDRAIIDGKPHMWIPGFGWIEDEGGGSIGIVVDGKGDINKQVGVMGGGSTTVGNPGDELTGHKVGIMGGDSGGTVAEDMYENGHKIGIMGGSKSPAKETTPPESVQLEPVDGEILI